MFKTCIVIHSKTGLMFNGYDTFYLRDKRSKGKNTLSPNNPKSFNPFGKTDEEIFQMAFGSNLIIKEDGKKDGKNIIVYSGSEIHSILSKY